MASTPFSWDLQEPWPATLYTGSAVTVGHLYFPMVNFYSFIIVSSKNDYALSEKAFKGAPAPKVTQLPLAMKFIRHRENNFVPAPNENIIVDSRNGTQTY